MDKRIKKQIKSLEVLLKNEYIEMIEEISTCHENTPEATLEDRERVSEYVNRILESLYRTPYQFSIPWEFIESPLGRLLFEAKYMSTQLYSSRDIAIMLGLEATNLGYNRTKGHLRMMAMGRFYVATEMDLKKFLKYKKYSDADITLLLTAFKNIKKLHDDQVLDVHVERQLFDDELKRLKKT